MFIVYYNTLGEHSFHNDVKINEVMNIALDGIRSDDEWNRRHGNGDSDLQYVGICHDSGQVYKELIKTEWYANNIDKEA